MKKDFKDSLDSFSRVNPAPADLIQNTNQEDEVDLDDVFLIINLFSKLSSTQKEQVLRQLQTITNHDSPGRNLNLSDAARILNKSDRTVKTYIKEGKLIGKKVKGRWCFNLDDIERCKRKL